MYIWGRGCAPTCVVDFVCVLIGKLEYYAGRMSSNLVVASVCYIVKASGSSNMPVLQGDQKDCDKSIISDRH